MAQPIYCPRINANDDFVTVRSVVAKVGQKVNPGDLLFEVETAKAVVNLEAEAPGFILQTLCQEGDEVETGAILAWVGETPEEAVPAVAHPPAQKNRAGLAAGAPTLKALELLRQHGLLEEMVPFEGDRLTAKDVENYLRQHPEGEAASKARSEPQAETERVTRIPFGSFAKGMASQVLWHRDNPVPAYCEIAFDPAPWEARARQVAQKNQLVLSPLLALMAFRLVSLVKQYPSINAYVDGQSLQAYRSVDLGFTVEASGRLYMVVVRNSDELTETEFSRRLVELQRAAFKDRLKPEEAGGATLAFTSLAKLGVTRHIPILPPRTSLILAHSSAPAAGVGQNQHAILGATYDHRGLDGVTVAKVLRHVSQPSED